VRALVSLIVSFRAAVGCRNGAVARSDCRNEASG